MSVQAPKPKVIVICGPTAVGKTEAVLQLAEELGGEIIGADSMQIYRYMDIGTAKPSAEEMARIPHHMIDVVEPDQAFNARAYAEMARGIVHRLDRRSTVCFVAGGTGLYIKALLSGLFDAAPTSPEIRARLNRQAAAEGTLGLHRRLSRYDPLAAGRIHPNDTYRIVRALEILEATGKPISELQQAHHVAKACFDAFRVGLTRPRELLYERINQRVDVMLEAGLPTEVEQLLAQGYAPELKSMQAIGYRHMVAHIQGDVSWEDAVGTLKRDTRRYAKRQLTWFRAEPRIAWTEPERLHRLRPAIKEFLQQS